MSKEPRRPKRFAICFSGNVVVSEDDLWPSEEKEGRPKHLTKEQVLQALKEKYDWRKEELFSCNRSDEFSDELVVTIRDEDGKEVTW